MPMLFRSILRTLCLLAVVVYLATTTTRADVTPQTATPSPEAITVDPDLRSPRTTVSYFLSVMEHSDGGSDVERATKALDTSELPELVRDERAQEIAVKLYAILTYKDISSSKVPSTVTTTPLHIGAVSDYGIYLEQVGPNWRFSKTTIKDTPDIFREIEQNLSKKEMRKLGGSAATWLTIRSYVPEKLKGTTLILEDWHWIAAGLTLLAAILLHVTLVLFIRRFLYRALPARFADQPNKTIALIRKPVFVIVFTSVFQLFLSTFDLQIDFYTFAVTWLSTIRILAMMLLAIRLIPMLHNRINRLASEATSVTEAVLYPLVEKVAWLCIIIVGFVQILWTHGVNVSGLAAGLGLGGLAFALAAKDTIENIFGAAAILIDQPFHVGDNISMGGITGTVEHIGLRSTRLRTPENSLISLPNSKIIGSHVDNLGARPFIRIRTGLNLPLSTPPASIEALCGGIRTLLASHPLCVDNSIVVHFNEFGASSFGVLVQCNIRVATWAEEQCRKEEIFLAIVRLLHELGLSLAVPTQEVAVKQLQAENTALAASDGMAAAKRLGVMWLP